MDSKKKIPDDKEEILVKVIYNDTEKADKTPELLASFCEGDEIN